MRAAQLESYRPCSDSACQIELGKALAAKKMLTTKVLRLGTACAMTATLYDLATETAEAAAAVRSGCSKSALVDGVDQLISVLVVQHASAPTSPPNRELGRHQR